MANVKQESNLTTYEETITTLQLGDITMPSTLQTRVDMSPKKVDEYSTAYRNGAKFPPILVAKQPNKLGDDEYLLLDGWHRVQALRNLQAERGTVIPARVIIVSKETSVHTLRYLGGRENLKNGLGLNSKDKHELFRAYVKGGANRESNRYKSYREIASDLALVPHQTIARWMKSDFPSIARRMSKQEDVSEDTNSEGTGKRVTNMPCLDDRERKLFGSNLLEEAKASGNDTRWEMIEWAKELVSILEKEAPAIPPAF